MSSEHHNSVCDLCGDSMVAVECSPWLSLDTQEVVRTNRLIWIRQNGLTSPPANACVQCEPRWLRVNDLELKAMRLQLKKEACVTSDDWSAAKLYQTKQRELEAEVSGLLAAMEIH